jgi:hypothetical protein
VREELYDAAIAASARRRLKIALRTYLYTTLPESEDEDDQTVQEIENLVEQSLDAIESVVRGYPPIVSVRMMVSGS